MEINDFEPEHVQKFVDILYSGNVPKESDFQLFSFDYPEEAMEDLLCNAHVLGRAVVALDKDKTILKKPLKQVELSRTLSRHSLDLFEGSAARERERERVTFFGCARLPLSRGSHFCRATGGITE